MPPNLDDAIPFFNDCVAAMGPEHPKEKIKEICVWVTQSLPNDAGDAAATEMTTHELAAGQHPHFVRVDGAKADLPGRWLLPVKKVSAADFQEGRAFAVALALVVEDIGEGKQRERFKWWGQAVELQRDKDLVDAANDAAHKAADRNPEANKEAQATLREGGKLAKPLEFKNL